MEKTRTLSLWSEEGYNIFAKEGLDGIHVEKLARMLSLNKSGFYHYFGDIQYFCLELIKLHEKKVTLLIQDVQQIKYLDPDYLDLLVKHAPTVMFQVQLVRNKETYPFYEASQKVDQRIDHAVLLLWRDFVGSHIQADLAMRYHSIVRDMLYTRISFQNFNYPFLHDLVSETKKLIDQVSHRTPSVECIRSRH